MVVPFGFSIGDFITVATLFKDIGVALKDHGGAACDYQNTLKKLETIQAIFLSLEDFNPSGASLAQVNAIRAQASSFGQDIGLFLKSIHRYERHLGCRSRRGFRHGIYSKIKWAQHVSKEASKMEESISFHVSILHTLMGMHTIDALSAAVLSQEGIKDLITSQAAENTQMLANISSQLRSSHKHIQQDLRSVLVLIISEIQDLDRRLRLPAQPSLVPATALSHASVMPAPILSSGDWRMYADTEDKSGMKGNSPGTTMALTTAHSRFSRHQMNDICNTLITDIERIFRFVVACALVALKEVLIFFPQMLFLVRMMRVLPRAISLMPQDCIRFEDAFSRVENLPYQYFRNWKTFEAMVHGNFKGLPGSRKIVRGQYTLTCPRLPGQQLTAASWGQQVFPGMTVVMAVNVRTGYISSAGCPKCFNNNTSSCSATSSRCHSCGLVFSRSFVTNIISTYGNNNLMRTPDSPHYDDRKSNNRAGRHELEMFQRVIQLLRSLSSEDSGRRLEELNDHGLANSGTRPVGTDNMSTNSDHESSDSEDDAGHLKVFKRVNLLQRRNKKTPKSSVKVSAQSSEQKPRDRKEDSDTGTEIIKVEEEDYDFGYPLRRVWARSGGRSHFPDEHE